MDMNLLIGEDGLTKYKDKRFHPLLKKSKRIYPHVALDLSDIYRHNDYIEKANKERLSCRQILIPCI